MRHLFFAAVLLLPSILPAAADIPNVKGDGVFDDTAGLQALLDSGNSTVVFPKPPKCYLISKTLKIHSGQTLIVDRNAVIRLADKAAAHLLANADREKGDNNITVIGGIWDGNNAGQLPHPLHNRNNRETPYDPQVYIGVLFVFDNVKNLHIDGVVFKDPETFALLAGNLNHFTIENITFDFNLLRGNMDGIHIAGNSHNGRIVNVKGTTNDDLVALNADDSPVVELAGGEISDILVDGIWSDDGYRAVRINSCGSPVKRVKVCNIFGSYRYDAVILSNHNVHPDRVNQSVFEDISISGMFTSRSLQGKNMKMPHIRIHSPAKVSNLTINDYHRTEKVNPDDSILIEKGATVDALLISNAVFFNHCDETACLVNNQGTLGKLMLSNVFLQKAQESNNGGNIQ